MWRLILVVFFWNGVHAWQTDPPTKLDDEMKSLIQQVEGTEGETKSAEEPHGLTFKTDAERALYQRAAEYLESCAASDWNTSYSFFWKPYRDAVSLASYLKQEKASIKAWGLPPSPEDKSTKQSEAWKNGKISSVAGNIFTHSDRF